jgi:hypothetical protein
MTLWQLYLERPPSGSASGRVRVTLAHLITYPVLASEVPARPGSADFCLNVAPA